jgi:alpha-ketoglutarate-dependent taurine dioxygenase
VTKRNQVFVAMKEGDVVLVDNYRTMHGRNIFEGTRKHAVTWFK